MFYTIMSYFSGEEPTLIIKHGLGITGTLETCLVYLNAQICFCLIFFFSTSDGHSI